MAMLAANIETNAATNMTDDRESLFSLEVVVDEISIPGITCRYPAVAVRLMDFPTLMIHHADDRLIRKIQVNLQQKAEVPRQFIELQDENENFPVKKGKSCLFKFNPKKLKHHLSSTPLYILVVDVYPEIPRLIASCVLPLCESMDKLYEHITTIGLAIPETDGKRGEFVLRNLMGVNVGTIKFGYRLLSLGEGLLQHIPKESLVVSKADQEVTEEERDDIPVRDVPKPKPAEEPVKSVKSKREKGVNRLRKSKPEILEISTVQHIFNESIMNREYFTSATQTDAPRRDKGVTTDELDDDVNIYRPPPLYFNSNAEEKFPVSRKPAADQQVAPPFGCGYTDEDEESVGDESVPEPQPVVFSSPRRVQLPKQTMQYADMHRRLAQFPVLGALFDELNRIQSSAFQVPDLSSRPQQKAKPKPKAKSPIKAPTKGKENREEFLARLAAPKDMQKFERPCSAKSPTPGDSVPKHKSWIRKEPLMVPKKSKLEYGMTNTQRLRLAMNNPQMLQEMEPDAVKSPIAQKLLENLAGFGKTRVLGGEPTDERERPVPTPRRHPPVRHSNEFKDKVTDQKALSDDDADEPDSESEDISPNADNGIHIPVAPVNENEVYDTLPPKFPGFKPEDDNIDSVPVRDTTTPRRHEPVRDSGGMTRAVINPKASKSSPISSLRTSQAFNQQMTARTEDDVPPTSKRRSLEYQAKMPSSAMKRVSFDANEDVDTRARGSSSDFDLGLYQRRQLKSKPSLESVHTDSVSSYAPSDADNELDYLRDDYDEYSDDFEVDIPSSPQHRPSFPNINQGGD